MTTPSPTRELARFAADLRTEKIPEPVRERVKDIILDSLASALAGHDASETPLILAMAKGLAGSEESSVIGGGRLSQAGATLMNGYLITAVTVCDIHRPTLCHVTPEVVPPALVTAERLAATGSEFLVAIAAGLEVTTRVGLGLNPPAFRSRGWHAPGITGPFGGAAAVGRLLGLDGELLAHAFGIAGSQAAGSYAQLGTPTIKFQQSRGALSGLISANLAAQGFESTQEILTHPDGGLFSAYSDGGDPDAVMTGAGERWELLQMSLRAWPVAVHLQPVITGLMEIVLANSMRPQDVSAVRVGISPTAYRMHGTRPWEDRFLARLSAPYVSGVVIHDHRCWLEQFTPVRVQDPALDSFIRGRVKVEADQSLEDGTATVEIETVEGKRHREHVTAAKGEPTNPLTREEIIQKFRDASVGFLSPETAQEVIDAITNLEGVSNMREIVDLLRVDVSTPT